MKKLFQCVIILLVSSVMSISVFAMDEISQIPPTVDTSVYTEPQAVSFDTTITEMQRSSDYDETWFFLSRGGYDLYEDQYADNLAEGAITSYVYGQNTLSNYGIGMYSMDDKGYTIVALHNALLYGGRRSELCALIRNFEMNHYLNMGGIFGCDPYAVSDYLDANLIPYTEYSQSPDYQSFCNYIDDNINTRQIYIVTFWNSDSIFGGAHSVAFYSNGGYLYAFNRYNNHTQSNTLNTPYESLDDLLIGTSNYTNTQDRFIVGYALGSRIRRDTQ